MIPQISVLICTYNRAARLEALLDTVCSQVADGFSFEVVIVDNNSTDNTRETVEALRARVKQPLSYVVERRQGKSYALSTGLLEISSPLCVVVDDDQLMPPGYLRRLTEAFWANPDASFIGGKVLPMWETPPPPWLTPEHWSPLGMADYGDKPLVVGPDRPICLLTFAFRVSDVLAVGGFRSELGVTGTRMGGTEDADLIVRLITAGRRGLYLPELVLQHHAPSDRMSRKYYRRWHRGHGSYSALRRDPVVESAAFRLLDVPSHLYRQALDDAFAYTRAKLTCDSTRSFSRQLRLCFFFGFAMERIRGALLTWRLVAVNRVSSEPNQPAG